MVVINIETIIHLPDLLFVKWCEERFRINRGVFNTIDSWFFEYGIENILERRKYIIYFLGQQIRGGGVIKNLRFGHGGLTPRLQLFVKEKSLQKAVVP